MEKISKGLLLLTGMLMFMIVLPTTFLVLLDGATMLQRVLKQMSPFL